MKIISQPGIDDGLALGRQKLSSTHNLLRRKKRVHRAGAEPFEIESHKLESKLLKNTSKLGNHLWSHGAKHLIARDLYTHNFTVVPHAKLPKPKLPERIFALLDGG